jgi:SPP1 gp7 family putative phage head morphogenesis protein
MSTKTHEHGVEALAQAPADVDPTRTRTLRRKYAQRLRGRFADINTVIREAVKERDLFRLDADTEALEVPMLPVRDFRFTSDDEKVTAFREWLDEAQEQEVLSVISRNNNEFVRAAYGRGIKHANARLREEGVEVSDETLQEIFRQPVHREKLQLLYTRSFTALEGITDDVGKEISRVLTQGLAEGVGPDEMSRRLTDRVDKIGKTRATTLARTEVINAHADATLTRYERMGIEEVTGDAEAEEKDDVEFQTAGDSRVCPICQSLEGRTFSTEEARGIIPVHPRCRCAWLPVVN